MKTALRIALGLSLIAVSAGCSKPRSEVSGTITRAGKALVWNGDGGNLLVIFFPEDRTSNDKVYSAQTDRATGKYSLPPIPAGRYMVAVQQFDEKFNDAFKAKYDPARSPLRYEVTMDGQVIDIDLP